MATADTRSSANQSRWKQVVGEKYLRLRRPRGRLIDAFRPHDHDASRVGLLATPDDTRLEWPQQERSERLSFFGRDATEGYFLQLSIRHDSQFTRAQLHLQLPNGEVLHLPTQFQFQQQKQPTSTEGLYQCHGLKLQVQHALRRWRLSFSGFLKRGEEDDVYVSFTLFWVPIHQPYDSRRRFNAALLAAQQQRWRPRLPPSSDWYDQWGCFCGTLDIQGQDQIFLRLRGKKHKQFGDDSIQRQMSVDVYIQDGTVLHVGVQVPTDDPQKHWESGYVIHCSDIYQEVQSCVVNWNEFGADGTPPKSLNVDAKTSGGRYQLQLSALAPGWASEEGRGQVYAVAYDKWEGWALVQSHFPSAIQHNQRFTPSNDLRLEEDGADVLVCALGSGLSRSSALVGGKGVGLSSIASLHFPHLFTVPAGVCVTVTAYFRHLQQHPTIQLSLQQLHQVAWQKTAGDLKDSCERVKAAFEGSCLCEETTTAITQLLRRIFGKENVEEMSFAVRSSARGEDEEETSGAGQNETLLGIKGLPQMWRAIVTCWASQFSYPAVEYKRQNGQLLDGGMGVVIQQMVAAQVAGVLFTADPVSGCTAQLTLTANYGLGQSVVSASVDPDSAVLRRNSSNQLTIHSKHLGKKTTKDILNVDGGCEASPTSSEERQRLCVSDGQLLQLGAVGVLLEETVSHPVDVEWAFSADGRLHLLQCRAITTLEQDSELLLAHEFDSGLLTDQEILSLANVGEVLPGSQPPLTQSITLTFLDLLFKTNLLEARKEVCENIYNFCALQLMQGQVVANFVNMSTFGTMKKMTSVLKASSYGMIGKDIMSGSMHEAMLHRYGLINKRRAWFIMRPAFQYLCSKNRLEKSARKELEKSNREIQPKDEETPLQYYQRLTQIYLPFKKGLMFLMCGSTYTGVWGSLILSILTRDQPDLSNEIMSDYASLLGGGNDVISAEVPRTLKNLSQHLPKHFASMSLQEASEWLKQDQETAGQIYTKLMKDHGHRCYKEFDLRQKCWSEDPTPIIIMLQGMLNAAATFEGPSKTEPSLDEVIAQLNTKLTNNQKRFLKKLVPYARRSVGARELGKSVCIEAVGVYRRGYRNLAQMMVHHGFLPFTDLLYFLTLQEIGQLLRTRSAQLINRAKRRRNLHPALDKIHFPDVFCGYPPLFHQRDEENEEISREDGSTVIIKATTACQGMIQAKVRVVKHIEEAPQIQAGEILITYATDIGWTPYFPLLSGIVTEIGGLLSHGAVIAREYGLPCLIAAENATKLFRSGDDVVLNATKGTIQLVN